MQACPKPYLNMSNRFFSRLHLWRTLAAAFCIALALWLAAPLLGLLGGLAALDAAMYAQLQAMLQTVLPGYALATLQLVLGVALVALVAGAGTAAMVTLFDFPARKTLEWLLLLPLAIPGYVAAYAYTDFLQFSGPAQNWLRAYLGTSGRMLPEIRSMPGAILLLGFTLYPYVYLLVRTALLERCKHLADAARMLGANTRQYVWRVALPLARPAMLAGVALVVMETLADYGVGSYFGIQTMSVGIYKAWLVMDAPELAGLLSLLLLALASFALHLQRRMQARLRYGASGAFTPAAQQRLRVTGWVAACMVAACAVPVLLGFVLPVLMMLRPLLQGLHTAAGLDRFMHWSANSLKLALLGTVLTVAAAWMLAFWQRTLASRHVRASVAAASMGYALPGSVAVVGLLLPWMQVGRWLPQCTFGSLLSTTLLGVLWVYASRFCAVALHSLQSGYSRIPLSLDASSHLLGRGLPALCAKLHAPLLQKSTLTAMLLVFADIMKELPATLVLRPFNHDTLAVITHQLASDERLGEAALPGLALVAVGLLPVLLLSRSIAAQRHSAGKSADSNPAVD